MSAVHAESRVQLSSASDRARRRFLRCDLHLFTADWHRVLFLHYETDPALLQPVVPFPLDCRGGLAYISLVAFTMRDLRVAASMPDALQKTLGRALTFPVATHEFFNIRTYVVQNGEPGIFFIGEWIPSRIAAFLGPRTFGLPYRLATMRYDQRADGRTWRGEVAPREGEGRMRFDVVTSPRWMNADESASSLTEFLLERYTAYTACRGVARRFRVWHQPWVVARGSATELDDSAFRALGRWARESRFIGAHGSPGVQDVWMSAPVRVPPGPAPLPAGAFCD